MVRGSLLDIIEKTGFDIIGGGLGEPLHVGSNKSFFNNWLNHGKYRVEKGSKGYCLKREFGFYGEGFDHFECDTSQSATRRHKS